MGGGAKGGGAKEQLCASVKHSIFWNNGGETAVSLVVSADARCGGCLGAEPVAPQGASRLFI